MIGHLICHRTECRYCDNEFCSRPVKAIGRNGACTFIYDQMGNMRNVEQHDYSDKLIVNFEYIEVKGDKQE